MADDQTSRPAAPVRGARSLMLQTEHIAYLVLGALIAVTALLGLAGAAFLLWHAVGEWPGTESIFEVMDRLLFVLMMVEILHTVRVSVQSGSLVPEPFLIVGLIASIRRILVITLESSSATQPGNWNDQSEALFRATMIELSVLGVLIVVMVLSIYLLRRSRGTGAAENANAS